MDLAKSTSALEAARVALLSYERATTSPSRLIEACSALSQADEADAIRLLDAAGAVDAVLDCDFSGNRRWRVRAVTSAGRDVARLIRDELVWAVLRDDLAASPSGMGELVRRANDAFVLA